MKRADWIKKSVGAGGEFHAMKATPWKHNLINGFATGWLFVLFWGTVALAHLMPAIAYIPLAGVLFGVVFFGVNILIVHECSHNMFVLTANRERQKSLNRAFGIAAAAPFFTDYINHWEKGHTIHHLRPCEDDDPQDKDPITGVELYKKYAMLAFIPFLPAAWNPSAQYPGKLKRVLIGVACWVPGLGLMYLAGGWEPLAAWVVGLNFVMVLNMTKKAQEHGCGLKYEPEPVLRSRTYLYPLQMLFSPFNINYHFEHHANFNVPWYKLPAYHEKLRGIMPNQLQPYYFHHDFMLQLSGKKELPPKELQHLMVGEPETA